ncbi:dehydration-responsive element-binding protein 1c [Quercus suber]|uniref:Dehydration-responsive element-binding protein 1c n=1 Tax=Quercus suber TaxID=58331 RepID=A0AAW0KSR9_QUESU
MPYARILQWVIAAVPYAHICQWVIVVMPYAYILQQEGHVSFPESEEARWEKEVQGDKTSSVSWSEEEEPTKWVCEIREPNKKSRIWLGTFPTAEMATRAHDVALIALRGQSGCLNFADSMWKLPIPASTTAKDIQRTAAEAAKAFRPAKLD